MEIQNGTSDPELVVHRPWDQYEGVWPSRLPTAGFYFNPKINDTSWSELTPTAELNEAQPTPVQPKENNVSEQGEGNVQPNRESYFKPFNAFGCFTENTEATNKALIGVSRSSSSLLQTSERRAKVLCFFTSKSSKIPFHQKKLKKKKNYENFTTVVII